MAGSLDTAFKNAAKSIVSDLGKGLDTKITYTRQVSPTYNTSTGALTTTDTSYANIYVPIEFVKSEEDFGREIRRAKIYLSPNLIGNNQPTLQDEIILSFAGSNKTAQITDIATYQGGQTYLFVISVSF